MNRLGVPGGENLANAGGGSGRHVAGSCSLTLHSPATSWGTWGDVQSQSGGNRKVGWGRQSYSGDPRGQIPEKEALPSGHPHPRACFPPWASTSASKMSDSLTLTPPPLVRWRHLLHPVRHGGAVSWGQPQHLNQPCFPPSALRAVPLCQHAKWLPRLPGDGAFLGQLPLPAEG